MNNAISDFKFEISNLPEGGILAESFDRQTSVETAGQQPSNALILPKTLPSLMQKFTIRIHLTKMEKSADDHGHRSR